MVNEQAQLLVAMSLSKIQNARSRRTGLNLHRSLLVSSVLFKAKTAIIMAKYNMKSEYESTDTEEEYYEDNTDDSDEEEQSPEIDESDAQVVPDLDNDSDNGSCEENIYDSVEGDKENSPPKDRVTSDNISEQASVDVKCNRCTKRRLTEVESAVESITKKQCTEEDNCITTDSESSTHEAMECGQISILTDSFHCGFSGLLSVNQSYNAAPSDNDARGSQGQGLSEAFNSCSTQIKESFETLTSPIMLSV